jgi:asparagine synthase (glutamine-hydrolysing)
MSGIAGIVHADGTPVDKQLLERMAVFLEFRGPDGKQVWSRGETGFCHTLLLTGPQRQAQTQPCTLDGKVWVLADARLDARENLVADLAGRQCRVSAATTDEELILHAWRVWGEECVRHLLGDFVLAIWDESARKLWCARDQMGARPFFYASLGSVFVFSNTLDCVRSHPVVGDALNLRAVGDFLLAAWNPDPATTIFRDVARLAPGHSLTLAEGRLRVGRYWALPIEEPLRLPRPEDYVESFGEILRRAVKDRLPEDRAALRMSGGLDSTSVAATARRVSSRERNSSCALQAFTVDYSRLFPHEEAHYAGLVQRHLGIPLEVLSAAESLPYEGWDGQGFQLPEPSHDPFWASHIDLVRRESGHARVTLSGEGGDAILEGQAWPYLLYLVRGGRIGTLARELGRFLLTHGRIPPLRGGFWLGLRRWVGRRSSEDDYPPWLNPDFERAQRLRERWQELRRPVASRHPIHPRAYASLTGPYWSSLLEGEDAAWVRIPIEVRAPFLDVRMVRFLLRIPPVPWCANKQLARAAMRGQLPDTIVKRRKTPLLADPLLAHVRRKSWAPEAPSKPVPCVEEFVNWPVLRETLAKGREDSLWRDLQAISFNSWLKCATASGTVSARGRK